MQKIYQTLRDALQQYDWVGSALVYDGALQGVQFLWQEDKILYAPEGMQDWAKEVLPLVTKQDSKTCVAVQENQIFVERFCNSPQWVILGGGHISLSLVRLGKLLGFSVTVVDDRQEFANTERFPEADNVACSDFQTAFSKIPDVPGSYYIVVTRGHQADLLCVREILNRKYAYLGMIGSKQKVAKTKQQLLEDGFSKQKIEEIYAPIGLKIGAVTPEEIAVCIAAEIIQVKNKNKIDTIDAQVLDALCTIEDCGLALIVQKDGSAPREAGARMVVKNGKIVAGSIGGGAVEYAALCHCDALQTGQQDLQHYVLQAEDSAALGMICGGNNLVYFSKK